MVLYEGGDDYFAAREQAMLAMEKELEERKSRALAEADQTILRAKSQTTQVWFVGVIDSPQFIVAAGTAASELTTLTTELRPDSSREKGRGNKY